MVSLGAGAAHRRVRDFLPWSALAGLAWAGYSVGLGYFGGRWLGSTWFGTAVSVLALFMAGALAAFLVKRPAAERDAAAAGTAESLRDSSEPATGSPSVRQDSVHGSAPGITSNTVPSQPNAPTPVTSPAPVSP